MVDKTGNKVSNTLVIIVIWTFLMFGNSIPILGRITVLSLFLLFLVFRWLLGGTVTSRYFFLKLSSGALILYFFLIILFKYTGITSVYNGLLSISSILFFVTLIDISINSYTFDNIINTCTNLSKLLIVLFFIASISGYSFMWISSSSLVFYTLYFILISKQRKISKVFYSLMWLVGAFINGERTLVLITMITPVFYLFFVKPKSKRLKRILFFSMMVFTIIIPIIYVWLSKSQYRLALDMLSIKLTTSRFFSGRDLAWSYLLSNIKETQSYLFGSGHGLSLFDISYLSFSSHNLYLSVLSRTGLIGLGLLYIFLYQIYSSYLDMPDSINKIGIYFLVITVLKQSSEYGLIGNNMVLSLVTWIVLALPYIKNNINVEGVLL